MAASTDPLGVAKKLIDASTLKAWSQSEAPSYPDIQPLKTSPFSYNSKLNQKLILW